MAPCYPLSQPGNKGKRSNPRWRVIDVPPDRAYMERVWKATAGLAFAFRRIFALRLAEKLLQHGVEAFATQNM